MAGLDPIEEDFLYLVKKQKSSFEKVSADVTDLLNQLKSCRDGLVNQPGNLEAQNLYLENSDNCTDRNYCI